MKFIVTGAQGQIAKALVRSLTLAGHEVTSFPKKTLDVTQEWMIKDLFSIDLFDVLVNCAAFTDVESAEQYPELAAGVNANALGCIGYYAKKHKKYVLHLSSNYVFDGKQSEPYSESDVASPISVYGATKLKGEGLLFDEARDFALILRLSWVFSEYEGCNFLLKFLRNLEKLKHAKVVNDQIGCPTSAHHVCKIIDKLAHKLVAKKGLGEIFHYCDAPAETWYSYAQAIIEESKAIDFIPEDYQCTPITTAEGKFIARRPVNGALDCKKICDFLNIQQFDWHSDLKNALLTVKNLETFFQ